MPGGYPHIAEQLSVDVTVQPLHQLRATQSRVHLQEHQRDLVFWGKYALRPRFGLALLLVRPKPGQLEVCKGCPDDVTYRIARHVRMCAGKGVINSRLAKKEKTSITVSVIKVSYQSGRRDSNPRPSAWKANALSTELLPQFVWAVMDSNHRRRKPAELQSAPFGHSGNCPLCFIALQRYALFLNMQAFIEKNLPFLLRLPLPRRPYSRSDHPHDLVLAPCCSLSTDRK